MVLDCICLVTKDVLGLSAFYQSVLQTTSDCDDAVHQEIFTNGAALVILLQEKEQMCGNPNFYIAFTVDDVESEYRRLMQLGVKITEPPMLRPWGAVNMIFEDPDGNRVVFRSFHNK